MGRVGTGAGVVAITASDSVDIAMRDGKYPRAVRFGTGGTCVYVAPDGSSATLKNIMNGEIVAIDCRRINASGLINCADMVGIY